MTSERPAPRAPQTSPSLHQTALDLVGLARDVLEPLAQGSPARYQPWDWTRCQRCEHREIPPSTTWLVVDGCGSDSRSARPHLSALA